MNDVDSIISQLEDQKGAIERAISALREISAPEASSVKKSKRGRPPGRAAAVNGSGSALPKKRRLSPEGRQRIVEALKKRWAIKKAGGKRATGRKRAGKASATAAAIQ